MCSFQFIGCGLRKCQPLEIKQSCGETIHASTDRPHNQKLCQLCSGDRYVARSSKFHFGIEVWFAISHFKSWQNDLPHQAALKCVAI